MQAISLKLAAAGAAVLMMTGCSSVNSLLNERVETQEFLRVYDVQTPLVAAELGKAIAEGMSQRFSHPQIERPLVFDAVPEKPGRLTTDAGLTDTNFAKLMQMSGGNTMQLKGVVCKGSPWQATGHRTFSTGDVDARLNVCVFPYKGGYHIDMYGYLMERKGGMKDLVRQSVYGVMGTPEQEISQGMADIVKAVEEVTGKQVNLIESQP